VGFEVVDLLAGRHGLTWESAPADAMMAKWRPAGALLAKPLTFMNLSGHAVGELLRYFKVDVAGLLVIVDEVQLDLGRLRTRPNGSAGGHNGLKSLIQQLGTDQFPRLRIGVGRGDRKWDLADHVLARFGREERDAVAEVVNRAADAAELFVEQDIEAAMNRFNQSSAASRKSQVDDD
jgi:peptidyl-tRNA hydrolase, PTH1 family